MSSLNDQSPSGVLLVDKDPGFTSHNAVALCRRILGTKKVGHCGTLDPMATGILIVVVGKATKLQDRLMSEDKVYSATIKLGVETNSYDADGEVVRVAPWDGIDEGKMRAALQGFCGEIEQVPPMYSAVKINGVPCYKLARRGEEVERKARRVRLMECEVRWLDLEVGELDVRLHCSKGFYVRSLAHDLGERLGCGAHLTALRRERSGAFDVESAISVPDLKAAGRDVLLRRLIPVEQLNFH